MSTLEIKQIETQLNIKLPQFYIETMLNYPFPLDSFAAELLLWADVESILMSNESRFGPEEGKFAIGCDGGELTYYLKLNGDEKVYIYDLEGSYIHNTLEAETWNDFIKSMQQTEEEILQDKLLEIERRKNKKWWQFWI